MNVSAIKIPQILLCLFPHAWSAVILILEYTAENFIYGRKDTGVAEQAMKREAAGRRAEPA